MGLGWLDVFRSHLIRDVMRDAFLELVNAENFQDTDLLSMFRDCYQHGYSQSLRALSSYHACHNGSFSAISLTKFLYLESRVFSSSRSFQLASESQETVFLVFMGSRLVLPLNTKLNSPMSIFFWLIKMRVARWNDYISLCFSYNPKQP